MVELIVIELPIKTGNVVDGLQNKDAVNELKQLLNVSNLDNADIEIPSKNDPSFPSKIKVTELKNFLTKYAGKQVRVHSISNAKPKLLTF
tara:strand:- start:728 stop:997 length:270 start_codon:yes stop_codon:yes gene_type:complete